MYSYFQRYLVKILVNSKTQKLSTEKKSSIQIKNYDVLVNCENVSPKEYLLRCKRRWKFLRFVRLNASPKSFYAKNLLFRLVSFSGSLNVKNKDQKHYLKSTTSKTSRSNHLQLYSGKKNQRTNLLKSKYSTFDYYFPSFFLNSLDLTVMNTRGLRRLEVFVQKPTPEFLAKTKGHRLSSWPAGPEIKGLDLWSETFGLSPVADRRSRPIGSGSYGPWPRPDQQHKRRFSLAGQGFIQGFGQRHLTKTDQLTYNLGMFDILSQTEYSTLVFKISYSRALQYYFYFAKKKNHLLGLGYSLWLVGLKAQDRRSRPYCSGPAGHDQRSRPLVYRLWLRPKVLTFGHGPLGLTAGQDPTGLRSLVFRQRLRQKVYGKSQLISHFKQSIWFRKKTKTRLQILILDVYFFFSKQLSLKIKNLCLSKTLDKFDNSSCSELSIIFQKLLVIYTYLKKQKKICYSFLPFLNIEGLTFGQGFNSPCTLPILATTNYSLKHMFWFKSLQKEEFSILKNVWPSKKSESSALCFSFSQKKSYGPVLFLGFPYTFLEGQQKDLAFNTGLKVNSPIRLLNFKHFVFVNFVLEAFLPSALFKIFPEGFLEVIVLAFHSQRSKVNLKAKKKPRVKTEGLDLWATPVACWSLADQRSSQSLLPREPKTFGLTPVAKTAGLDLWSETFGLSPVARPEGSEPKGPWPVRPDEAKALEAFAPRCTPSASMVFESVAFGLLEGPTTTEPWARLSVVGSSPKGFKGHRYFLKKDPNANNSSLRLLFQPKGLLAFRPKTKGLAQRALAPQAFGQTQRVRAYRALAPQAFGLVRRTMTRRVRVHRTMAFRPTNGNLKIFNQRINTKTKWTFSTYLKGIDIGLLKTRKKQSKGGFAEKLTAPQQFFYDKEETVWTQSSLIVRLKKKALVVNSNFIDKIPFSCLLNLKPFGRKISFFEDSQIFFDYNFKLIRPLFLLTRLDTFYICKSLKLPLYPDKSNQEVQLLRNRIRKQILPAIRILVNPQFDRIMCNFSDSFFSIKKKFFD